MVPRAVERFLRVYREEQSSFLLVLTLFMCFRASNIMVENYAETTFLKRYGVEYLPEVFLVNSIILFAVVTLVGYFVDRMSRTALLRRLILVFAGLLMAARFLLPLDIDLLYPFLYVLVAQSRYALVVVFWLICGGLYSYRQTKRLFPPIEAGGVLGLVAGSFASGPLGRLLSVDNVLVVAVLVLLAAALATFRVERAAPAVTAKRPPGAGRATGMEEVRDSLKEVVSLIRGNRFILLLSALVILPNFVMPVFSFQWSVILDRRFLSEEGLLMFYSIFKGISNGINLVLLLFVGRLITRFGVSAVLLLHPANYLFLFGALLGSFTLPVAIYGRISSSIIRTSANRPAMRILFNLVSPDLRGRVVPFLQGTVGRTGTLLGSALLLAGSPFISPRLFGLLGCLAAGLWLTVSWLLRRHYTSTLFEGLMAGHLDLRALEQVRVRDLLDKRTVERLLKALEQQGATAALAAELLAETADPEVARRMLAHVPKAPEEVQAAILDAVGEMGPIGLARELEALVGRLKPTPAARCVAALGRTAPTASRDFLRRCLSEPHPGVRAEAAAGLCRTGDKELRGVARRALMDQLARGGEELAAAVEAIPTSRDTGFLEPLSALVQDAEPEVKEATARTLGQLRGDGALGLLIELLSDASAGVRREAALALGEFPPGKPRVVDALIERLEDEELQVSESAVSALVTIGDEAVPRLLEALGGAPMVLREAILRVLSEMEMPESEIIDPVKKELERAYGLVVERAALEGLEASPGRDFIMEAIGADITSRLRAAFRLLQATGLGRELDLVRRGLVSKDAHLKAVAVEGLEKVIHRDVGRLLVPLVEEVPLRELTELASKAFGVAPPTVEELIERCLAGDDPVLQVGACALVAERGEHQRWAGTVRRLAREGPPAVVSQARVFEQKEKVMPHLSTLEKVLFLRRVELFNTLDVRALTAIATIAEERTLESGGLLCREGERGDSMFCIVDGSVEVLKERPDGSVLELAVVEPPEVLGEMALFDDEPRSATLRARRQSTVLNIDRAAFEEIMSEYPQVGASASRILSRRLRKAAELLKGQEGSAASIE